MPISPILVQATYNNARVHGIECLAGKTTEDVWAPNSSNTSPCFQLVNTKLWKCLNDFKVKI